LNANAKFQNELANRVAKPRQPECKNGVAPHFDPDPRQSSGSRGGNRQGKIRKSGSDLHFTQSKYEALEDSRRSKAVASELRKFSPATAGKLSRAFRFAVVIRSAFARGYGATGEMLNRYIGGESKRDSTTDFSWYREFVTRNTVSSPHGSLALATRHPPLAAASKL
jgi:hypothetical protein